MTKATYNFRTILMAGITPAVIALSIQAAALLDNGTQFFAGYEKAHTVLPANHLGDAKTAMESFQRPSLQ